jgi:hypothetical protein
MKPTISIAILSLVWMLLDSEAAGIERALFRQEMTDYRGSVMVTEPWKSGFLIESHGRMVSTPCFVYEKSSVQISYNRVTILIFLSVPPADSLPPKCQHTPSIRLQSIPFTSFQFIILKLSYHLSLSSLKVIGKDFPNQHEAGSTQIRNRCLQNRLPATCWSLA